MLAMLTVRALDAGFWRGLTSELIGIRKSLPGIRAAGLSRYLDYLAKHYFRAPDYRLPRAPCDLCGGGDFSAVFFLGEQKKVRCESCGLEFVERKPIDGWDVADEVFEREETVEFFEKIWSNADLWATRIERLNRMFERIGVPLLRAGGRAFEIGCGEGDFLRHLKERGLEVEGIETSNRLVEHCRKRLGLNVNKGTVRDFSVPPDSYDLVLAYHVTEHLDKPSQLFNKARRMLRPGGFLVVEVPVPDLSNLSLKDQLDVHYGYANRHHLHYFRPETVTRYFETHGFTVVGTLEIVYDVLPAMSFLGRKE
jgi:2-polyprenyl-3-methyl-5-hydroxy-6-metoxy-1,4-benzoquinol methylase